MSSSNDELDEYDVEGESSSGPSTLETRRKAASAQSVKKRKLTRACDLCRKRKVRCDFVELPSGTLDKCLNCFSSKVECTFSEDIKPRPSSKSYVQLLEAKVKRSERLLKLLCPDENYREELLSGKVDSLPPPPEALRLLRASRDGNQSEGQKNALLNGTVKAVLARMTRHDIPQHSDDADNASDIEVPRLVTRLYQPPDERPMWFIGESSETELILKAIRLKKKWENGEDKSKSPTCKEKAQAISQDFGIGSSTSLRCAPMIRRRKEFWELHPWEHPLELVHDGRPPQTFHFPDPPLMRTLLSLYFKHSNLELPLIHRPTLERELQENLHLTNESFAVTVLLMCAIGARYSDDPAVLLNEDEFERALNDMKAWVSPADMQRLREARPNSLSYSQGWKYFEQAWNAKGTVKVLLSPSLYDIQFYSLSVIYLRSSSLPQASWTVVGIGFRLLQDIGGHRQFKGSARARSTAEEELMKRACWVLVSLDRALSAATGRPWALADEELDVELPKECDDEYWDHPDPQLRFHQPSDKPSLITAFNLSIRLNEILNIVLRTIYATKNMLRFLKIPKKEMDQRIVSHVDSGLNTWLSSLPPHLRWDPNQPNEQFLTQSASLHVLFYHIHILLHRPFIPSPRRPSTVSFPSLAICTTAARSIVRVASAFLDRTGEIGVEMGLPIFTAGVVLLLKAWDSKKSERSSEQQFEKEMEDVNQCLVLLRVVERRIFSAGKLFDILYGLTVNDIRRPPSLESGKAGQKATGQSVAASNDPMYPTPNQVAKSEETPIPIPYERSQPSPTAAIHPGTVPSSYHRHSSVSLSNPSVPSGWPPSPAPIRVHGNGSVITLSANLNGNGDPNWTQASSPSSLSLGSGSGFDSLAGYSYLSKSLIPPSSFDDMRVFPGSPAGPIGGPHHHNQSLQHHNSQNGLEEMFSRSDSAFDLNSASIEELGISNLWDWGIPFQDADPISQLMSDPLFQWQQFQTPVSQSSQGQKHRF